MSILLIIEHYNESIEDSIVITNKIYLYTDSLSMVQPIFEWVASHQDENTTINITTLSTGTKLSIEADVLTTKGLQRLHTKPKAPLNTLLLDVMIHQQGRTTTTDLMTCIRTNIQLPIMEKYYQQNFSWLRLVYGKIN